MERSIRNPVFKDEVIFIRTSEETRGRKTELKIMLQPDGYYPLHFHKEYSETFTSLEGTVGIKHGNHRQTLLEPSESYTAMKGETHAFFNPNNDKVTFKIDIKPGQTGFEQSLRILYGLAQDGLVDDRSVPLDINHTAVINRLSQVRLAGLGMQTMRPFLKWLGYRAEKNGLQNELIKKYCT